MQSTNRGHLAVVALIGCQEVTAAKRSMLVHGIQKKAEAVLLSVSTIGFPASLLQYLQVQEAGPVIECLDSPATEHLLLKVVNDIARYWLPRVEEAGGGEGFLQIIKPGEHHTVSDQGGD